MHRAIRDLLRRYALALRDEPRMRRYLYAALTDDAGIAVSAWASYLLQANLFTDQRQRARLMVPTLLCVLLGNLVSGPLADWAERRDPARLAWWRWRIVIGGRAFETVALASLVLLIAGGTPTIAQVLPYMMVSAFLKTALRPTRIAFEVDLLTVASPQLDGAGRPLYDEHGQPRIYKEHLLSVGALSTALQSASALLGLLLGGVLMAAAHHAYWPLFAFDVLTNVAFIVVVALACRPAGDPTLSLLPRSASRAGVLRQFVTSLRDGVRFLSAPAQRPLLALLCGSWLIEIVTEAYDGKMIVRQVLHGSDDDIRHALLAWSLVSLLLVLVMPILARAVGSLARVFLLLMLVDGLLIALAGRIACVPVAASIVPFALVLGLDHALTEGATTLVKVAANSASSAGMRGRIAAAYGLFALLGEMAIELLATHWSEAVGMAPMLVQIGLLQVALVAVIALVGGRRLWRFGLHRDHDVAAEPAAP